MVKKSDEYGIMDYIMGNRSQKTKPSKQDEELKKISKNIYRSNSTGKTILYVSVSAMIFSLVSTGLNSYNTAKSIYDDLKSDDPIPTCSGGCDNQSLVPIYNAIDILDEIVSNDTFCYADTCNLIDSNTAILNESINILNEITTNGTFCLNPTCESLSVLITTLEGLLTENSSVNLVNITSQLTDLMNIVSNGTFATLPISRSSIQSGTAGHVIINHDSTGVLSSEARLSTSRGGTGTDSSASNGIPHVNAGTWTYSVIVNADVSASAGVARTKLASGTASHVLINDGSGVMTSEAQLSVSRGGIGTDSSSANGIPHVSSGTWSFSPVTNSDVSASAAISRTKLGSGTASHVLINDGSGVMSSEAQLSTLRGGTGKDTSSSTGYVYVDNGDWTFVSFTSPNLTNAITNNEVATGAAIARNKLASGTANHVLINSGTGVMSSEAQLSTLRGGTGTDSSSSTGIPHVNGGTWTYSSIVNADVSASAGITRSKLASGTASHVLINDGSGVLSSEAQLSTLRGGTGKDTSSSTGYCYVDNGDWTFVSIPTSTPNLTNAISNNEIAVGANIARNKLASGTANHVLINDGSGVMSSEIRLSTSRGGTNVDSSSSTGYAYVSGGSWTFVSIPSSNLTNSITNSEVAVGAAIARNKLASGTASHALINDGSGVMSSEAQLSTLRGGTGTDSSASSGIPHVNTGTWTYSSIVNADVSAAAGITRSKLASGTASHVIINDGSGVLSSEAQLSNTRGGTGTDSSTATGIPHVASGTWTYSTIVNADVSNSAAITRSKLASGTADHVIINDGSGVLSSESRLATTRGGTNVDSSSSTGYAYVSGGSWSFVSIPSANLTNSITNSEVAIGAAIARNKLASGTTNHVLINDGSGVMSSEAQLSTTRGGTGTDSSSSSGIPHVSTGTWTYSSIVNVDVSAAAGITRSKLASGTASHVIINDGSGVLSSEAQLSNTRGGTGIDSSSSTGVPTVSSGTWSITKSTPTGNFVGTTDTQTLTNKNITDTTNNVAANSLKSATTIIDVSAATAPSVGQVLTATSSTAATWQTPTGSSGALSYTFSTSQVQFTDVTSATTVTYTTTQLGIATTKLNVIQRHGLGGTVNDAFPSAATIYAALPVSEQVVGSVRRMYLFNTDTTAGSKIEWKQGSGGWPVSITIKNNAFALSNGMGCEIWLVVTSTTTMDLYAWTPQK